MNPFAYAAFGALGICAVIGLWCEVRDHCRKRVFRATIAARTPLLDAELAARFFADGTVPPDVLGRVRRLFAEHFDLPAEKLLPDDDLSVFWLELDPLRFLVDLEEAFEITLSDAEAERMQLTVRAVARLVAAKTGPPG